MILHDDRYLDLLAVVRLLNLLTMSCGNTDAHPTVRDPMTKHIGAPSLLSIHKVGGPTRI